MREEGQFRRNFRTVSRFRTFRRVCYVELPHSDSRIDGDESSYKLKARRIFEIANLASLSPITPRSNSRNNVSKQKHSRGINFTSFGVYRAQISLPYPFLKRIRQSRFSSSLPLSISSSFVSFVPVPHRHYQKPHQNLPIPTPSRLPKFLLSVRRLISSLIWKLISCSQGLL